MAFSLREGQHLFENDMFSQRHLLPDCSPFLDLFSGPRLLHRRWWSVAASERGGPRARVGLCLNWSSENLVTSH